jgi:hypothetical protein
MMVATFATASPLLLQAHLLSGVLAVYLLPASWLAMAWLVLRRAPWLASAVMLVVLIGTLPSLGLLLIGSIPAALAILKVPFNQNQRVVDKSV